MAVSQSRCDEIGVRPILWRNLQDRALERWRSAESFRKLLGPLAEYRVCVQDKNPEGRHEEVLCSYGCTEVLSLKRLRLCVNVSGETTLVIWRLS